ncbi:MAG: phosphatidylserine/phosphatidylglycerophosphate/cardiolipin synthase family protein [Alphaproteobacteria bacterium]|nr:phosphatidylserine/phosphatidylglycerophosphate/cardiolipin synthase family protein [Alphaproteobacteria bacterium]MBV9370408.1 phosphatidylserine/phosphatidylglycerophosphate/cardiolipin synthase family protein [Alphaproteobacteria bacterium]MBV9900325.1 phosphatidylserine/phosphatidylglycerophosphate/cardiolipin synthase family protein [Alphaproteobacteria bacterium]
MTTCVRSTGPRSTERPLRRRFDLLLGAQAFWTRAEADILAARRRVLVQAMTFEGDSAGLAVAAAVRRSRAGDRRILVDDYTRVVVSDRFVLSPHYLASPAFRAEVGSTRAMFRSLRDEGVGVRTTNPIAGRLPRYGLRNHKKLIVADNVAYIGGVNFSDHNFAWHDLMLRIEARGPAGFLAEDFDATWRSRSTFRTASFDGLDLYALDGRRNPSGFADLLRAIAGAERRIDVVSPYLSSPFVEALGAAARRGVRVELVAPLANNKPMVRHFLLDRAPKLGLHLRLVPGMFHLKGMLIDERRLALGSSNFDFPSYYSMEEYLALIDEPALVETFVERVLRPMRGEAVDAGRLRPSPWHVLRSRIVLSLGRAVVSHVGRNRRTAVEWTG